MRTHNMSITRWLKWNGTALKPDWNSPVGTELCVAVLSCCCRSHKAPQAKTFLPLTVDYRCTSSAIRARIHALIQLFARSTMHALVALAIAVYASGTSMLATLAWLLLRLTTSRTRFAHACCQTVALVFGIWYCDIQHSAFGIWHSAFDTATDNDNGIGLTIGIHWHRLILLLVLGIMAFICTS